MNSHEIATAPRTHVGILCASGHPKGQLQGIMASSGKGNATKAQWLISYGWPTQGWSLDGGKGAMGTFETSRPRISALRKCMLTFIQLRVLIRSLALLLQAPARFLVPGFDCLAASAIFTAKAEALRLNRWKLPSTN